MDLNQLKLKVDTHEIDTVLVVFPDVYGRLMGKRFTAHHFLRHVAEKETHACNYLLTVNLEMDPVKGFKLASWDKGYGDFAMKPDLSTLRILPWFPATAFVLCHLQDEQGQPVAEAPRSVLQTQLQALSRRGWECKIASELEFYLFNHSYHEAYSSGYQTLAPSSDYRIDYHSLQPGRDEPLMRALRNSMEAAGIPVESSKGEWGKGQHELNFLYDHPLVVADRHGLFKQGAKEIAEQHGKSITFMPKYSASEAGSSCHIHLSLWQGETNLFWDATTGQGSRLFRQFLGGLLTFSPQLCYFFAPTINAYKRYQPGSWAPTKMAWSRDNRTTGFRVVGEGGSFRIENRMPGADANPYLAFAAMMLAGLAGVERELDCGPAYEGNAYIDSTLASLPHSLEAAGRLLAQSTLAREGWGDAVVDFYTHTALNEVREYADAVTDWERVRYFEQI